jgi:regulator of protease activity HflC (stomatin/prohibitin superfamily)
MKKLMLLVTSLCLVILTGCSRVEPGHVGIKINYYGSQRGVGQIPLLTGMVFYNPMTETVLQYPTFVQTAIWTRSPLEGSPNNEEISFNSSDGAVFTADLSLSYQLDASKIPDFYVKFRSDNLSNFTHGFLRNVARDCINEVSAKYTAEQLYSSSKEEFLRLAKERINSQVTTFGVEIQQFGFVGAPRPPQNIVDSINNKIQATQDAQRAQNQVAQAEAIARSRVATAEGEAKANSVLASSVTPALLEWKKLEISAKLAEKWDGRQPETLVTGTGGNSLILQLPANKSEK